MHEYSIDVENNKIIFFLSIVSIFISSGLTTIINLIILKIPYIEIVISVTAISIFGILYSLFDKFIWKWKILNKLGIIKIPNLNGRWEGQFQSSYYDFKENLPVSLIIEQSWSKICIKGKFNHSKSSSNTASIKVNLGKEIKLLYSYYNDKKPEYYNLGTSNHRGYANLEIYENAMEGNYFNDPINNDNWGKMKLEKVDKL
ncbi:TPA: hypothetical protein ACU2YK_002666 [Staphylococcus aureus]